MAQALQQKQTATLKTSSGHVPQRAMACDRAGCLVDGVLGVAGGEGGNDDEHCEPGGGQQPGSDSRSRMMLSA